MTETIKKGYKVESFLITKENIDDFEIMENRRQIGDHHVLAIIGAFSRNINPMGVLLVNRKKQKMRLIDGNHRIEALRRILSRKINESTKVEVTLKVYENLTDEEERIIYTREASRKNETYEDRLNMYKDTIIFWKLLTDKINGFPCKITIYPSKESLKFRSILNAIYAAKNTTAKGYSPTHLKKEKIIEFAQEQKYDDFVTMKEFTEFFQNTFGKIESSNMYSKTNFFIPIFHIYMKNYSRRKDKQFRERFKRVLGRTELMNLMNSAGREAQQKIRELMIGYMNHGIHTNTFT